VSNILLFSIPAFIALILIEMAWAARTRRDIVGYERRDTQASLSLGLLNVGVNALTKIPLLALMTWLYEHRVVDVVEAVGAWSWLVLFFAEDFCYYWFHRLHHETRFLWAAHVNHHSSRHFNLSTALRQPLLTPITGPWFWAPLPLVGFEPAMVLTAQAVSLLYQFWIHTEAVDRLGPLEWIFNTPSHHRVHHGKNIAYLDKNHGGVLIIWDRLFGTFAREDERVVYGLTTDIRTFHPLRIGLHEVAAIARDVARAPTLRAKLGYIFAPPGWSHDGSTKTAGQLRASAGLQ
jgi:sterol desaturase/sphingolipid hydroxylase (fatty acid hydroxylase superfamily)